MTKLHKDFFEHHSTAVRGPGKCLFNWYFLPFQVIFILTYDLRGNIPIHSNLYRLAFNNSFCHFLSECKYSIPFSVFCDMYVWYILVHIFTPRSTNYGSSFTKINSLVEDATLYHIFFTSDLNRNLVRGQIMLMCLY